MRSSRQPAALVGLPTVASRANPASPTTLVRDEMQRARVPSDVPLSGRLRRTTTSHTLLTLKKITLPLLPSMQASRSRVRPWPSASRPPAAVLCWWWPVATALDVPFTAPAVRALAPPASALASRHPPVRLYPLALFSRNRLAAKNQPHRHQVPLSLLSAALAVAESRT